MILAKHILNGAVKVPDVEEAVLRECGLISSRAVGAEQSTPRLEAPKKKFSFGELASSALLTLPYKEFN